MNLTIEIPDDKKPALMAKAMTLGVSAEQYVQQVVGNDLEQPPGASSATPSRRPISEIVGDIWRDLPDDARAALPSDGAAQVDHYVYGLPKREQ